MAVYSVIVVADSLITRLISNFVETNPGGNCKFTVASVAAIGNLLVRRDMLSKILFLSSTSHKHLPWEEIIVCVRWICKSVNLLKEEFKYDESVPQKICLVAEGELLRFHLALGEYWQRPVFFEKLRLWKEGGHAAVPSRSSDWTLLGAIRGMALPMRHQLPHFADTILEKIDFASSPQNLRGNISE